MSVSPFRHSDSPRSSWEGESAQPENEEETGRLESLYEQRAKIIIDFLEKLRDIEIEIVEERLRTGEPDDITDLTRDFVFYTENTGWLTKIGRPLAEAVVEDEDNVIAILRQEDQSPEPNPPFPRTA